MSSSVNTAIRSAELSFNNYTFLDARRDITYECRGVQDAKYNGHGGHDAQFKLDNRGLEMKSRAVRMIMLLIQIQLPTEERPRLMNDQWRAVATESHRKLDDHNDGFALCALAAYANVPYPLFPSLSETTVRHVARPKQTGLVRLAVVAIYSGPDLIRGSCALLKSACWNNVTLHLLHSDQWEGHGQKVAMLRAFCKLLTHKESKTGDRWIVMLVDMYDTLLQTSEQEVIDRFVGSGHSAVISSENNCFPFGMPLHDLNLDRTVCDLFRRDNMGHRAWPNTGGIIGYAGSLQAAYRSIRHVPSSMVNRWPGSDQGLVGQMYLSRMTEFSIDTNSTFWATSGAVKQSRYNGKIGWAASDSPHTMTAPALHFQGAGTHCFKAFDDSMWYNHDDSHAQCPHTTGALFYEYDRRVHTFAHPVRLNSAHTSKCASFKCECTNCECNPNEPHEIVPVGDRGVFECRPNNGRRLDKCHTCGPLLPR